MRFTRGPVLIGLRARPLALVVPALVPVVSGAADRSRGDHGVPPGEDQHDD
jgi:hypothetical protein